MTSSSQAIDSFSCAVEKASKLHRFGDLRLFGQEIQGLNFETEASRILIKSLTTLNHSKAASAPHTHVFLFTGHMIDAPKRPKPRFPAKKEPAAASAIQRALKSEIARVRSLNDADCSILGITSGACGGDILFHEACEANNVSCHMYLPFPKAIFLKTSVQFAGTDWVNRFEQIYNQLLPHERPVLNDKKELPSWLKGKKDYSIWVRNNLWMLHNALIYGGHNVSLFALWNGEGGDGVGGTQDMVTKASEQGAQVIIIDTKKEFDLT